MSFELKPEIEELLNGYIDGELAAEEQNKVRRLIEADESIARRLAELDRCRLLVSSLPPAQPPAEVISGIKQVIKSRSAHVAGQARQQGARHLFARHAIAAAVMIGLLGLFAAVVYKIAGPQKEAPQMFAAQPVPEPKTQPQPPLMAQPVGDVTPDVADVGFYSLRLATGDFVGVDAFINKMLDESPWLEYDAAKDRPGQSVYRIICTRAGLDELVNDLAGVWSKFDSATLVVHGDDVGDYVAVVAVRPEQITDIANEQTHNDRVRLAKDFAVLNDAEQLMPAKKILAYLETDYTELINIPRPALTSAEQRVPPLDSSDKICVDLTIEVKGHK